MLGQSKRLCLSAVVCATAFVCVGTIDSSNNKSQAKTIEAVDLMPEYIKKLNIESLEKIVKEEEEVVEVKVSTTNLEQTDNEISKDVPKEEVKKEVAEKPAQPEPSKPPKKETPAAPKKNYKEITVICTFYTSLACENGGWAGRTANGGYLSSTSVAMPKDIPFGTKIEIDGFGTRVCDDRGSIEYIKWIDSNTMAIDVHIQRKKGEDDDSYYVRVNNMGRVKAKAKLYL